MKPVILIFSIKHDQHADRIAEHLQHDCHVVRLNLDELTTWRLSFLNDEVFIHFHQQKIHMSDIHAVFLRRIPSFEAFLKLVPQEYDEYRDFIAKQDFQLFTDCLAILDETTFFMNPLKSARNLGKLLQQNIANSCGLKTPLTYVGNNQDEAINFVSHLRKTNKRISTKPVSNNKVLIDGIESIRFTELLLESDENQLDTLAACPVIFQEYIEKKYEIRGIYVSGRILACAIYSQEADKRTAIDWRHYNIAQTPHYAIELPPAINEKLIKLHRRLDVRYSAFDLIVTPQDEYYFLETNPYGQWLWIEDLTGLPMTNLIASSLMSRR